MNVMICFLGMSVPFLLLISFCITRGVTARARIRMNNNAERSTRAHVPEIPGAWPLAGHLPLLIGRGNLPRILATLGDRCGTPAFTIRIGLSRWLIVNEWKAVKECFTTNDKVFASRPASTTAIHVGHNQAIFAFSPYGSYWRDMRKFMVNEFLSNSKLQSNRQLRLSEIDHFIKDIYAFIKSTNGLGGGITKPLPIVEWSNRLMLNMITMIVARKRYGYMKTGDEAHQILKAMGELMNGAGLLALPDAFPFALVQWLDPQGNIRMLKRISAQLGAILGCWINEHQLRRAGDQYVHDEDFIDLLIS